MTRIWSLFDPSSSADFSCHTADVHIWQVALEQHDAVIAQLQTLLSADEVQRAARFHFSADQRRYIVGRGVLRMLLGRYLASDPQTLRFDYNAYGKPQLASPIDEASLQFNLSHSGAMALYAFARHCQLGIDLEQIRPDIEWATLTSQVFSRQEQQAFAALPLEERVAAFFRGWTRKEAFIKAHGKGLSLPLDQFDITLTSAEPARLLATHYDPQDVHNWSLCSVTCPVGYAAALATSGQPRPLVYGLCDLA